MIRTVGCCQWWCVRLYDTVIHSGFKCMFQLYSSGFSISWYRYMYHTCDIVHWSAAPHHSLHDCFMGVRYFSAECHFVFRLLIPWLCFISSGYLWILLGFLWSFFLFWTTCLDFPILQMRTSLDVSAPGHSFWILDWSYYLRTHLCHV